MTRARMLSLAGFALAAIAGCRREAPAAQPGREQVEAAVTEARQAADKLGQQLLAALGQAMADRGPSGAIDVCETRAPQIAREIAAAGKLEIGRTALRVRNPANAADEWERRILQEFEQELAGGASPATLDARRVEPDGKGWRLRWMKPIVLQPVCVACHGEGAEIDEATRSALAARYPRDEATGFEPGELRGAFTASVSIPAR